MIELSEQTVRMRAAMMRRCTEERWEEPGVTFCDVYCQWLCDLLAQQDDGTWTFSLRYMSRGSATVWVQLVPRGARAVSWRMFGRELDEMALVACARAVSRLVRLVSDAAMEAR